MHNSKETQKGSTMRNKFLAIGGLTSGLSGALISGYLFAFPTDDTGFAMARISWGILSMTLLGLGGILLSVAIFITLSKRKQFSLRNTFFAISAISIVIIAFTLSITVETEGFVSVVINPQDVTQFEKTKFSFMIGKVCEVRLEGLKREKMGEIQNEVDLQIKLRGKKSLAKSIFSPTVLAMSQKDFKNRLAAEFSKELGVSPLRVDLTLPSSNSFLE